MAPEGFSGRFGSGSDEVTEGVRTLAGDFRSLLWDGISKNICILGARGQTALHGAAKYGDAAVVEQLISAGATVDAASNAQSGVRRLFGSGSGEVMEGVRTLAGEFVHWQVIFVLWFGNLWDVESCLVLKDPYVTYL